MPAGTKVLAGGVPAAFIDISTEVTLAFSSKTENLIVIFRKSEQSQPHEILQSGWVLQKEARV